MHVVPSVDTVPEILSDNDVDPFQIANFPEALQPGVVTAEQAELAEDSGITTAFFPRMVAPIPAAAVASAAFLIKPLLFADSIVDSQPRLFAGFETCLEEFLRTADSKVDSGQTVVESSIERPS